MAGVLRGHYWVEVALPDGTRGVVDITADQFGHPTVRSLPLAAAADAYLPGSQVTVDASVRDFERDFALTAHTAVAPGRATR